MSTSPSRVVVIGAGFSGLASAGLLAASGHQVTVLEQHPTLGGRSGRLHREGFRFDTGPSWYLMPEVFEHWFNLMGTGVEEHLELRELPVGYRTFFEDGAAPVDMGTGDAVRELFEELEPGSAAALDKYLAQAGTSYALALKHFLYDDFRSLRGLLNPGLARHARSLAPLLASDLHGYIAKRFANPQLRQILGYPAVFLGSSPRRTPALYQLMSHLDLVDGVKYPMGGFAGLADAMGQLAISRGATVHLGATATKIETAKRPGPAVEAVRWVDAAGNLQRTEADFVIGAADLHHLEGELLDPQLHSHPAKSWKSKDPGPSAVLLCLGISGQLPELEHHNLLFTRDWDDNFARIHEGRELDEQTSIYVCKPSATDPGVAPEGHENLFILVPAPALPEWGRGGADGQGDFMVEQVADAAIDQLAAWARIPDLRERVVVRQSIGPADFLTQYGAFRGSALGLAHTLGQSAMLRPGNQSSKVAGLYFAGSSVRPGIGVPMCLISGELAAKAVNGIGTPGAIDEAQWAQVCGVGQ
ncbi:phytoene dehydrogenase [Glutamicibacter sp. BW80]|uniref:phytoene desaturase family protein n=1 Tax=unclassified Glutamicibacter TaxID=2627139 RepID=UPI000BB87DB2|nr:phytoene desaturase family protein [Glutamicibacter sp. BW80]PCC27435.1 phytoene dehydrogenase [Glutamicibacter sp. BW80]